MAGNPYLWRIEQGEAESMTFPVEISGEALTVTGWAVDAKIKVNPRGPVLYTVPPEHVDINGSNITLRVPGSVSETWPWSVAWYRVKITDPDSPVDDPVTYRVLQGTVLVEPD